MADQIIQLYAATTASGSQANVANIQVPFDGILDGILLSMSADLDADGEYAIVQVAETAAEQVAVNDARGVLASGRVFMGLLTSGAGVPSLVVYVPVDKRVDGGLLIYLHFFTSASLQVQAAATLYFSRRGR